jgi:hypothetical protein
MTIKDLISALKCVSALIDSYSLHILLFTFILLKNSNIKILLM